MKARKKKKKLQWQTVGNVEGPQKPARFVMPSLKGKKLEHFLEREIAEEVRVIEHEYEHRAQTKQKQRNRQKPRVDNLKKTLSERRGRRAKVLSNKNEPTLFERLAKDLRFFGIATAAGLSWLKNLVKPGDEQRLLAIEKAYDQAYYRKIACKRLIKKITDQLHQERRKDQTIEQILELRQQEAIALEYLKETLRKTQKSIPEILKKRNPAIVRSRTNPHTEADAIIKKSELSGVTRVYERMERKILEKEGMSYPLLNISGELNPEFYHLPEKQIIAKEKEAAAMEAVLARIPALDIDKLSNTELTFMQPNIVSASEQLLEVHDYMIVALERLNAAEEAARRQILLWQERQEMALSGGNTELAEQALSRGKQFVDSADRLLSAKADFEKMMKSIDEKIERLHAVLKRIEVRLADKIPVEEQ